MGLKKYETRSWKTNYRGKLVICSARKNNKQQRQEYSTLKNKYQITEAWEDLPFGYAIAICELTDCIEMTDDFIQTISKVERDCGDWKVGRYAWKLDNVRVLDNPIPIKGKQGLWNIELNSNLSLSSIKKKLYTNRYRDGQTLCSKNGENASLSISCLVKQPKQPEVKGIIQKDLGDRFVVEVDSEQISVSKLFVYPNFSKTVAQIPPSKNSPTKARRKKGEGTGYIYRRTVTRRGKQYQESYFRYRDESGKLKAKYIPQKLLSKVEEAESAKKPIADILFLLGGDEISRGEHSDNVPLQTLQTQNKSDELIPVSRGEHSTPPSNKRRKQGEGTGYIRYKPIEISGKEYKQYWYHYEEWREGGRKLKKSRYIPKRLITRVQKMEAEKAPVNKILEVLAGKDKRSKK